jgi:hypothetical protein
MIACFCPMEKDVHFWSFAVRSSALLRRDEEKASCASRSIQLLFPDV